MGGSYILDECLKRQNKGKFFHIYVPQEENKKFHEVFLHRERILLVCFLSHDYFFAEKQALSINAEEHTK